MDNRLDNQPENTEEKNENIEEKKTETGQPVYTDPNADVKNAPYQSGNNMNTNYNQQYQQQYQYQQNQQNMGYNYTGGGQMNDSQQYNYYNQNQNYNNYDQLDKSPLSMGGWLLTILALCIPCAGIIIYFVWAFSKKGNLNRRNFCRAALIVYGVILLLYIILIVLFGVIGSTVYYY